VISTVARSNPVLLLLLFARLNCGSRLMTPFAVRLIFVCVLQRCLPLLASCAKAK
jgi:hypothetical protein